MADINLGSMGASLTPTPAAVAGPVGQGESSVNPTPTTPASPPPSTPLTTTVKDLTPTPAQTPATPAVSFPDGSGFTSTGQVLPPTPQQQTDQINNAAQTAFNTVTSSPSTANPTYSNPEAAATAAQAQDIISSGTTNVNNDNSKITALEDPNAIENKDNAELQTLGITGLQQKVNDAQANYNSIVAQSKLNKQNDEVQYQGGTEGAVSALDTKQQAQFAVQALAASTALQAAQSNLNSNMDIFKTFSTAATDDQKDTISAVSQQLGLDKADLTMGVTLLNQAREEQSNSDTAAKSLLIGLAQNVPGVFATLSPSDQQALTQGNITPSILAAIGQSAIKAQVQMGVDVSKLTGQTTGLQSMGVANGQTTAAQSDAQQRIDISRQRLGVYTQSVLGGGSVDGQAAAQNIANGVNDLNSIPQPLQGYFEQKVNSDGSTYIVSKVTSKAQANAFASAYSSYWKQNASATYQPDQTAATGQSYSPATVATQIQKYIAAGKGFTDIRALCQSSGVPLTVYTTALKQVLSAGK